MPDPNSPPLAAVASDTSSPPPAAVTSTEIPVAPILSTVAAAEALPAVSADSVPTEAEATAPDAFETTSPPAPRDPSLPPPPSPSTVPEPELPEPSAAASFGVLLLMIGIVSAIVVLIVAIVAAGIFAVRSYTGTQHAVADHAPVAAPSMNAPESSPPAIAPPPVLPSVAAPPPAVAVAPTPAPAQTPTPRAERGPFVSSMSPTTGEVGDPITLHGRGLGGVEDVILFPQHGGAFVETAVISADDRSVSFHTPAVEKPEGFQPGDGYYVGVFAKTGACLLVDGTFRSLKPTDTAVVTADAVRIKFNSPLAGGDRLLVFGDTGATLTLGDSCVALLRSNCTLNHFGGADKIFYMPPLHTPPGTDLTGVTSLANIRLSSRGPRLMLKPLGDPGLPPDPN